MSDNHSMFGTYNTEGTIGVNPPYEPAYPLEWGSEAVHRLDVICKINPAVVEKMFAMGKPATPFKPVNDRAAFQFIKSVGHTMSAHNPCMFDMMVTIAVRYENYFAHTHLHMYNSDTIAIMAGREVLGFPEKDCRYGFTETPGGGVAGWVNRRGYPIADFKFAPDATAPCVPLVEGDEQPRGEIHVRRVPDIGKLDTAYSDIVYRDAPQKLVSVTPGNVEMNLYGSEEFDPLKALEPEILSAQLLVFDAYDGTLQNEGRKLVKQLLP